MHFVDSHLHLSESRDASQVLRFASSTGTLLFACGVDRASSEETMEMARLSPDLIRAFVGIHPSEATNMGETGWIQSALAEASGVGEIGLDPKYSEVSERSPQMRAFLEQLATAEKAQKPVQVHTRNAERECLDRLGSFRLAAVLLHWFNGEGMLSAAEQRGYFVSFGPALLQSKKLQGMASKYPEGLMLVESDAPVAFPSLGGAGGPAMVPAVVFKLAQIKHRTFEEMAVRVAQSSAAYLPSLRWKG